MFWYVLPSFATPEAREDLRSLAARLVLQESLCSRWTSIQRVRHFPASRPCCPTAEPTKKRAESHDTLMHTFRGTAVFPTWWLFLRRAYEWLWCRRHSAPPPTGQMSRQSVAPCLNGSPHLRIEPREQIGMNRVSVRQKQTLFLMQHDKTKMDMRICSYTFRWSDGASIKHSFARLCLMAASPLLENCRKTENWQEKHLILSPFLSTWQSEICWDFLLSTTLLLQLSLIVITSKLLSYSSWAWNLRTFVGGTAWRIIPMDVSG